MINNGIVFFVENKIQMLSVFVSLLLLALILKLIKTRRLKEEYSLLWLGSGFFFLIVSIFRPLLEVLAEAVGIFYAPAALLLFLVAAGFLILIQFSIVISRLSEQNKNLTQELGIIRLELKNLKRK